MGVGLFILTASVLFILDRYAFESLIDDRNKSFDWHRQNGKYRVRYPDGNISQPFGFSTAKDYKAMFGGEIIRK